MHRRRFLKVSVASWLLAGRSGQLSAGHLSGGEPAPGVPSVAERMRALESDAPLTLQFRGKTADEAREWQARFAARLNGLLGPYRPPEKWSCALERRVELTDHVREERVLSAAGVAPLPFHLLLPRGAEKKSPGIVALHGHSQFAHDYVAGLLQYGDIAEISGLIAPRPCVWEIGARDDLINPEWAEKALVRLDRAYAALSAGDQVYVDRFDGGHEWHGTLAYKVFDEVLRKND